MDKWTSMIILHRDAKGFHAEHLGPIAHEVRSLFGTTIIPTAWTAAADPQQVKAAVQRLNPGVEVYLNPDLLPLEV